MADHSLEAFRKGTNSLGDFYKRQAEYQKNETLRRLSESKLRGDAIVKKNEEYIAKHREAEYQRQKAEAEKKLHDALSHREQSAREWHAVGGPGELPVPDELSVWHKLLNPPNKAVEPGVEYNPNKFRGHDYSDPSLRVYQHAPSWTDPDARHRHNIKARGFHIINRCIVT
jgi:hypothetical protein